MNHSRDKLIETMARASCRSLWEGEPPCGGVCEACENGIKAALTALEAEGVVFVPREPTEGMVRAAGGALKTYIESLSDEERAKLRPRKLASGDTAGYKIAPHIKAAVRWKAMIEAASPAPPGGGNG